jgi:4-diphosphocytidyl-2-C-methyl-D-erythritol kinase
MQSIDLADRLEFYPGQRGRITLRCPDSDLPTDEGNLVLRAACLLAERAGTRRGGRGRVGGAEIAGCGSFRRRR